MMMAQLKTKLSMVERQHLLTCREQQMGSDAQTLTFILATAETCVAFTGEKKEETTPG